MIFQGWHQSTLTVSWDLCAQHVTSGGALMSRLSSLRINPHIEVEGPKYFILATSLELHAPYKKVYPPLEKRQRDLLRN